MPISFTCPHCGKATSVADQYAGQTGPCAACGKTITVPGTATPFAPRNDGAAVTAGVSVGVVVLAVVGIAALCVIPVLIALLLPAVQAAREAARRMQSMNNMKQISLALHNYHDTHNEFPPAVVKGAAGQPLYSGRVLLLPFLEQRPLYDQFKLDEPWNSPANKPLSDMALKIFSDPSSPRQNSNQTDYLFVVGQGTTLDGTGKLSFGNIPDGTSNTLYLVEVKDSGIAWAEPRDLPINGPTPLPPGNHPGGNLAAFFDGSVRFLSKNIDPQTVHRLATPADGQAIPLDY